MRSRKRAFLLVAEVVAALILLCVLWVLRPGSGTEIPEERVETVRVLTIGETSEKSLQRVSAALSEITLEQLGCAVELRMIRAEEYDERIDDLLLESDFADIFVCRNRTTINKLLEGNYVYRLDRYLAAFPEFRQAVPEENAWAQTEVDGYIYGIPFGNDTESNWGFLMRQDICDMLGIDPGSISTLEELHAVLLRVQSAFPNVIPVVSDRGQMQNFASSDLLAGGGGYLVTEDGIINICQLPQFQERCEVMRQWNDEGLILEDAPFSSEGIASWLASGVAFGAFVEADRYTVRELEYALEDSVAYAQLDGTFYKDDVSDMSFAVYAYTENVEQCLQVLRLIYTDPDVLRMCIYGQEGIDYTDSGYGSVIPAAEIPREERYINWCWALRDNVPAPITSKEPEWYVGRREEEDNFLFDHRSVSNEIYQCSGILEKYFEPLCAGMIDEIEGIAMMEEELETANMETVRLELESQYNTSISLR